MRMALVDPAGIVVGLLDWDTAATFTPQPGYVLRPAGDAHVGDTGVIPNSALASPVKAQVIDQRNLNFALTTAGAFVSTLPLVVPAGMTSLCFSLTSQILVRNTTATSDSFSAALYLDATTYVSFIGMPTVAPGADGSGVSVSSYGRTGVTPGSTVNLQIWAISTFANWPAYLNNITDMKGFILWTR